MHAVQNIIKRILAFLFVNIAVLKVEFPSFNCMGHAPSGQFQSEYLIIYSKLKVPQTTWRKVEAHREALLATKCKALGSFLRKKVKRNEKNGDCGRSLSG